MYWPGAAKLRNSKAKANESIKLEVTKAKAKQVREVTTHTHVYNLFDQTNQQMIARFHAFADFAEISVGDEVWCKE